MRLLVNESGTTVGEYVHDAWGVLETHTGDDSPKTYVDGLVVHDDRADSDLLYMRQRFYDFALGRFLNKDPIGFSGGLNLFPYGASNPVTYTDHTGLSPSGVADVVCRRLD